MPPKRKRSMRDKSLIRAMAIQILRFDYDEFVRNLPENKSNEYHDQYLLDFYGWELFLIGEEST